MNWGLVTRRFVFIAVSLIGLFDLFVAAFGPASGTISLQLFHLTLGDVSFQKTTLTFALGYFVGHILGRIDK